MAVKYTERVFGGNNSKLIGLLLEQSKLLIMLGKDQDAVDVCKRSLEIVRQTYGDRHEAVDEVQEILRAMLQKVHREGTAKQ